jgi:hypothetical protein
VKFQQYLETISYHPSSENEIEKQGGDDYILDKTRAPIGQPVHLPIQICV